MNLDSFIAKYTGQSVLFAPSPARESLRGQCVQLVAFYCSDVLHVPNMWKDAAEWWYQFSLPDQFDKVSANNLQRGDIVIWDRALPHSGGAGHIAVYLQNNGSTFISFDSNWGGKYAHQVTHNMSYVLGGLRKKNAAPVPTPTTQGAIEMIQDVDQATKIYKMLRPNIGGSQAEIDATAGHRSYAEFLTSAQTEVTNRDANLRAQSEQLQALQSTINQLNTTITQLRSDMANKDTQGSEKAQQLKDAQDKISELTAQLTTTHDQIIQLQSQAPAQPTTTSPASTDTAKIIDQTTPWYIKLIASFIPKK